MVWPLSQTNVKEGDQCEREVLSQLMKPSADGPQQHIKRVYANHASHGVYTVSTQPNACMLHSRPVRPAHALPSLQLLLACSLPARQAATPAAGDSECADSRRSTSAAGPGQATAGPAARHGAWKSWPVQPRLSVSAITTSHRRAWQQTATAPNMRNTRACTTWPSVMVAPVASSSRTAGAAGRSTQGS